MQKKITGLGAYDQIIDGRIVEVAVKAIEQFFTEVYNEKNTYNKK